MDSHSTCRERHRRTAARAGSSPPGTSPGACDRRAWRCGRARRPCPTAGRTAPARRDVSRRVRTGRQSRAAQRETCGAGCRSDYPELRHPARQSLHRACPPERARALSRGELQHHLAALSCRSQLATTAVPFEPTTFCGVSVISPLPNAKDADSVGTSSPPLAPDHCTLSTNTSVNSYLRYSTGSLPPALKSVMVPFLKCVPEQQF